MAGHSEVRICSAENDYQAKLQPVPLSLPLIPQLRCKEVHTQLNIHAVVSGGCQGLHFGSFSCDITPMCLNIFILEIQTKTPTSLFGGQWLQVPSLRLALDTFTLWACWPHYFIHTCLMEELKDSYIPLWKVIVPSKKNSVKSCLSKEVQVFSCLTGEPRNSPWI